MGWVLSCFWFCCCGFGLCWCVVVGFVGFLFWCGGLCCFCWGCVVFWWLWCLLLCFLLLGVDLFWGGGLLLVLVFVLCFVLLMRGNGVFRNLLIWRFAVSGGTMGFVFHVLA
ncbi:hypothetical protein VSS95_27555, partial [Pseudomonas syringae pv. tagetis]